MSIQFTSLRYYEIAQAKNNHIFIKNSKRMIFWPKKGFEKPYFSSLNIIILLLVKFLIMDF
jgi:hypothetical protein